MSRKLGTRAHDKTKPNFPMCSLVSSVSPRWGCSAQASPRHTEIAMLPRQITHQNIFRVLIACFRLVVLLLVAAAIVGIRNIQSIQKNADNLVREQSLSNRLIDELHSQQTTLSEVFSVLARDPDSVDYYKIMSQLD